MQGQSSVGLAGAAKDLVHEALRRQIHSSQGAVQPPRLKGRVYGGRRDAGRWEIAHGRMRPCAWHGAHGELHGMEVDVPPMMKCTSSSSCRCCRRFFLKASSLATSRFSFLTVSMRTAFSECSRCCSSTASWFYAEPGKRG